MDSETDQETQGCCCTQNYRRINKNLLVSKLFYFCYWGAVGSFFPLLGVYFKQLGMNPTQSGILVGCRPMVEFFSAPLLGSLADRLNQRKTLMIFSLMCWICFTFSFAFIKPAPVTCHKYMLLSLTNVSRIASQETRELTDLLKDVKPEDKKSVGPHDATHFKEYITKSTLLFSPEGVHQVFLVLLFLTIIGEFFSAPAITLADSATLQMLGENKELYGRQRMWGSLGWGTAMFLLGFVIDNMDGVSVCGEIISQNYTVGFYFFVVFMGCAFIVATRFNFRTTITDFEVHTGASLIQVLCTLRYISFLAVAFFMGFGVGLIFTFLFWHLEDLGGPPTLFGIASLIDHISEIISYFNVGLLITKIGHIRVLYIGLIGNMVRFVYISWLVNPWYVLPLEILQGVTHAAVWAACTSYMGRSAPPGYGTSAQGVLQGLHHGLGRGCGAIIGGVLIHIYGTERVFRWYGLASVVVLVIYAFVQYLLGPQYELMDKPPPPEADGLDFTVHPSPGRSSVTTNTGSISPTVLQGPLSPAIYTFKGMQEHRNVDHNLQ